MDYAKHYPKLFASLGEEERGLLLRLLADDKCSMKNSVELGVDKETFLKEFKSGPSLDVIEASAKRFELKKAKEVESVEHYIAFISYLTLDCPAARAVQRMEELESKWKGGPYYSAFTFHSLDKEDYVLVGFEDGMDS